MKAILMSIRPRHNKNILNGIKLLEIRKKFPIDYVGWVYIYNTKDIKNGYLTNAYIGNKLEFITSYSHHPKYRGKVVARFWCDKVEDYVYGHKWSWEQGAPMWGADNSYEKILKNACLTDDELRAYVEDLSFSAIHITKLEIFDKPKEISEFKSYKKNIVNTKINGMVFETELDNSLIKAPQSWCYIEV